jgi:uncharacterized protein YggU (UPF0235/DUF167 family)
MVRLPVHARPGARRERVQLLPDGTLSVSVRARAVEGQANEAVERTLAKALGLRPRQVVLVSGHAARRKIVEIDLPGQADVKERLLAHAMRSS